MSKMYLDEKTMQWYWVPSGGKPKNYSEAPPPLPCKEPKKENSMYQRIDDPTTHSTTVTTSNTFDFEKANESPIQNPPHYNKHPSGIECIQVTRHMNFNLGNAVKYIWRADLKNDAIEDLKKAAWYIQDEIQRREKK